MTTIPTLGEFPVAPNPDDGEESFNLYAYPFFNHFPDTFEGEMNAIVTAINAVGLEMQSIGATALASSNFKGAWSSLSGALNIPASVYHNGSYWMLLSNLANVATATPGVSASWQVIPTTPQRNHIHNASMSVAQRGTSFTSATTFLNSDTFHTLDRWKIFSDGNDIVDVTQATDVPANAGVYSIGLDVETVNKKFGICQIIEQRDSSDLIGNTVTLSFMARVTATTKLDNVKAAIIAWSGTADTVTTDLISAWGVEGTNPTLVANATYENTPANLGVTTSWARYSVTAAVDTASTKNIAVFIWSDVTDTTLGDFLYITDVQLEKGPAATVFNRRTFADDLYICQRYYFRFLNSSGNSHYFGLTTGASSTRVLSGVLQIPVPLRTTPSVTVSGMSVNDTSYSSVAAVTAIAVYTGSDINWIFDITVASGLSTGTVYIVALATSGYISLSSDL